MKKLILSALALSTLFISCEKESLLPEADPNNGISNSLTSRSSGSDFGVSEEYPYEIYNPGEGETYLLLEEGLADLFSEDASGGTTDIARGIWLIESGNNYAHMTLQDPENPYLKDYDENYSKERSITLDLVEGRLQNSDIKAEIIRTYNDVSNEINNETMLQLVDLQFLSLDGDRISLNLIERYYVNAVFSSASPWSPPTVDPASKDKYAGLYTEECGSNVNDSGSWKDAQRRVKRALPKPAYVNRSKFNSNVFSFNSFGLPHAAGNTRHLDGTYLPGHPNALFVAHRTSTLSRSECLSVAEQNAYAQAMVDQLHAVLGKRNHWDGVAWFRVDRSTPFNQYVNWGYYADLATWPTMPNNHKITVPWVK